MPGRSLTLAAVLAAFSLAFTPSARAVPVFETVHTFSNPGDFPTGLLYQDTNGDFYGMTRFGGAVSYGAIFKYSAGGVVPVANFNYLNGTTPAGRLIKAPDGNFYGAAAGDGTQNFGAVFQLTPAGKLKAIAKFTGANGVSPTGTLVVGNDGQLYGTTKQGGAKGGGAIFKVSLTGTLRLVASFDAATTGATPQGGLVKDGTGNLWGVAAAGGAHSVGTVFKLDTQNHLTAEASFDTPTTGSAPNGSLILAQDGSFYGVSTQGGPPPSGHTAAGSIFKFTPGTGLSAVYVFDATLSATTGAGPTGELLETTAGHFYGKTNAGGTNNTGVIYELTVPQDNSAPAFRVIDSLPQFTDASGGLTLGADGALWSTDSGAPGAVYRVPITGGSYELKATLGNTDGYNLSSGVVTGPDGQLYGACAEGGSLGNGTVYKLSTAGAVTHSASFGINGARPFARLLPASDGNLYGTVPFGNPYASIYRVDSTGALTILVSSSTLSNPGPLIEFAGAFYGTSGNGFNVNAGNFFKYSAANGVEEITEFEAGFPANPSSGFVRGFDDALYATFARGGAFEKGGILRLGSDGSLEVTATFNGANGAGPNGPLVLGPDGSFYGMTARGGKFNNGTVYKLTPQRQLKALTHLNSLTGAFPIGGLAFGPKGLLYGVTQQGGKGQFGTLFKVTTTGVLTVITNFDSTNGAFPQATLAAGPDGNLYGTTYNTVFRINTANHAPTANPDSLVLPVYGVKLTANDRDPDGDALRVTSVSQPMHGTVTLNVDGTIDYVPDGTFTTSDSFTYTITDGMTSVQGSATVGLPANLLTAGVGAYVGTLTENADTAGFWGVTVMRTGSFTGAVQLAGGKVVLKGLFSAAGVFNQDVTVAGTVYHLNLTLNPGLNTISGSITQGPHTYNLSLVRAFPAFTAAHQTTRAGRYSLLLPPTSAELVNGPRGVGYATAVISSTGRIAITGKLGDGQAFSAGTSLTHADSFAFLADLAYRKHGYLLGAATFAPAMGSDLSGGIAWHKPMQTAPGLYQGGFDFPGTLIGTRYFAPPASTVVLPFAATANNASINFDNASVTKTLTISNLNKITVTAPGAEHIVMTLNAATGIFTGTFLPTGAAPARSFGGVIYQDSATPGQGTYVGATGADRVLITPVP